MNTKEYNEQYMTNLGQWSLAKDNERENQSLNEILISLFMQKGCDFWINVENLNPYNKQGMIMISLSFNYIGTNKFYGYITTEYYNELQETFGGEK